MQVIDSALIESLLDYRSCIDALDAAMRDVSKREAVLPLRWGMPLPDGAGLMGMMPGCVPNIGRMGLKVVNILPANRERGLSSHTGTMLLFDLETGVALAALDADELTARRTAAASALATRILARPDSRRLSILGCGELAAHHIAAIRCVMDINTVVLWNRTRVTAETLADALQDNDIDVAVCDDPQSAVADADIVCTLTGSPSPILESGWLQPGVHVNAAGSSDASKHELDPACVVDHRYIVDYRISAEHQAGELIENLDSGRTMDELVEAEIGEVLLNREPFRRDDDDVTIYRSLGVAAQDLYAANLVFDRFNST